MGPDPHVRRRAGLFSLVADAFRARRSRVLSLTLPVAWVPIPPGHEGTHHSARQQRGGSAPGLRDGRAARRQRALRRGALETRVRDVRRPLRILSRDARHAVCAAEVICAARRRVGEEGARLVGRGNPSGCPSGDRLVVGAGLARRGGGCPGPVRVGDSLYAPAQPRAVVPPLVPAVGGAGDVDRSHLDC